MNRLVDSPVEIDERSLTGFTASLDFSAHPILKTRGTTKGRYFTALEMLANACGFDAAITAARLSQYKAFLRENGAFKAEAHISGHKHMESVAEDYSKPWRREYRSVLLCDLALILLHDESVEKAYKMIAQHLSGVNLACFTKLYRLLYNDMPVPPQFVGVRSLVQQFRTNRLFVRQEAARVLVTANMSAGKSTLINALVGKPVTKTSQAACTANLCFLYNKPFEDGRLHVIEPVSDLDASYEELSQLEKESITGIASYFRTAGHPPRRICLIDTPGVNSALNSDHGRLTRKILSTEHFDLLIHVLNAGSLGTDDEIRHLKFVYAHVPDEKVVFVLNKLDCFKKSDDSVSESLAGVKRDLEKIGFRNPVICPMSANFAFLVKMKQNKEALCPDEEDLLAYYIKKFKRPEFDLSRFHPKETSETAPTEDEWGKLSAISGIRNLEEILYRG